MYQQQYIRWKDQPQVSSIPDNLLQKNDPQIEGVPSAIAKEFQSLLDQAQANGMAVEADDNDEDDDNISQDDIQVEDITEDTNDDDDDDESVIYGETINNDSLYQ